MVRPVVLPDPPLHGGCQCGRVRYRVAGRPLVFYLCHCRECQRHTSSAFGESLWVKRADLAVEGDLSLTTRVSDAGRLREGWFCPFCGVRIYQGSPNSNEATLKAGTLDDARWLAPAGHIWTASKQAFMAIGADELAYPGEPDDFGPLMERWREMTEAGEFSKK